MSHEKNTCVSADVIHEPGWCQPIDINLLRLIVGSTPFGIEPISFVGLHTVIVDHLKIVIDQVVAFAAIGENIAGH